MLTINFYGSNNAEDLYISVFGFLKKINLIMLIKDITAFIIAGGKSTRFGQDKLFYKIDGIPLLERVVNILKNIFQDIIIIGNDAEKFAYLGLESHPDILQGFGPVAGIYTALKISDTEKNFCVAADLPFLSSGLIEYMVSVSESYDIIVPVINGFYEALHAIYSKNCIDAIKNNLDKGNIQIIKFYEGYKLRKIEESEIKKFADPAQIFKNINSREDLV
jgi:molybdenum cofactor guanylyltransferase